MIPKEKAFQHISLSAFQQKTVISFQWSVIRKSNEQRAMSKGKERRAVKRGLSGEIYNFLECLSPEIKNVWFPRQLVFCPGYKLKANS
jgi:hypothetical protein